MSSDDKKKWGTIFLDANRESSLSKLDAMQAATRQEQWNQKTQQDYLESVRQKAINRAREILGEAYTERQQVLAEAERDADKIREEAQAVYADAEKIRLEAEQIRLDAQGELEAAEHIRNSAHEEGFQTGVEQAQEELQEFRAAMGSSVAGVLYAIETQCMYIFNDWRNELVELMKVCVEKGTALVLEERHQKTLEAMLLKVIRNLNERHSITLRVNPDDEAVVEDLFSAAKEKNPDLSPWRVSADSSLNPGDIIAESLTGSVDSRREHYHHMVDNILRHLALPESQSETDALARIHKVLEEEILKVQELAPPLPEPEPEPQPLPEPLPLTDPEMILTTTPPLTPEIETESVVEDEQDLPELPAFEEEHNSTSLSPDMVGTQNFDALDSDAMQQNEFAHEDVVSHDTPHVESVPVTFGTHASRDDAAQQSIQSSAKSTPPRVSFDNADAGQDHILTPEELEAQQKFFARINNQEPKPNPSIQELEDELLPVEALPPATLDSVEEFDSAEFFSEDDTPYTPIKDKA